MPERGLIYEEPQPMTREEAYSALATNEPELICSALVAVALHDPDWRWVQDKCLEFARHPEAAVRQIAATCIGHVARIHQKLDFEAVTPILHQLLTDTEMYVSGCAEDAIDDTKTFMGVNLRH